MITRRISRLEVENFKSLGEFKLDLPKFTCLIGLNGVGKSTVLQFVDFLSQLVRGNMEDWLEERKWKAGDLRSKLGKNKKLHISFEVRFCDDAGNPAGRWEGVYSPSNHRCIREKIDMLDFTLRSSGEEIEARCVTGPIPEGWKDWHGPISFNYQGSILSALKEDVLPVSILECKRIFQSIESLDTLTPERLRQRTREAKGSLGHGGKNLSAFLFELGPAGRKQLTKALKEAYPRLDQIIANPLKSGWKELLASEIFGEVKISTQAAHLNDGILRLIAILAELQSDHHFLLFDEIENGINPELVEFVIDKLVKSTQQVLVTTHSPLILNYLEDDVAKESVIYLYKTEEGFTEAIPFFSIPSLREKLEMMGPGEAFADTHLTELAAEIAQVTMEEK
jgi:predicted ATPase